MAHSNASGRYRRIRVAFTEPAEYRIAVDGRLEERLRDRLAGMRIDWAAREDGTCVTTLTGRVRDQAELLGVLNALYDMHAPIIAAQAVEETGKT